MKVNLEAYEAFEETGSKGKLGDVMWKPADEKLLTPQEAKAKWLEREVQSLKTVLNKVAEGSSYDISTAWPLETWPNCLAAELPNPTLLEQPSTGQGRGDRALHGTVLGDLPQQDRALQPGVPLRGALHSTALGEESQQARALHGTVLGEVPQQARALNATLCLEMFLNKLMRCVAWFLAIYLNVIGLCKLAAVLVRLFNVLNLAVILLVECEGKDLSEWVQCRCHGNLLEEETAASRPARTSMWSYATAIWRLALLVRSHHEGSVQCCRTLVGSDGPSSPNLLPGVEGCVTSATSATLTASS